MTITNPNATGTLYYKLVPDGTAKDEVSYAVYAEPLNISEQSVTIYAYIVDGINSSEYVKNVFTIKGENTLLNSTGQQAAMMNIGTLVLDKNLAIVVPEGEGVSKHPKTHKEGVSKHPPFLCLYLYL